jgi:FMN phosphatase YigB (HAD superfamily)
LSADHVVSATDEGVGVLKPHPRGLELLISAAGAKAHQTMLIGDRADRDGLAAQRAGALALIRSSRPMEAWRTFKSFDDPVFAPLLEG